MGILAEVAGLESRAARIRSSATAESHPLVARTKEVWGCDAAAWAFLCRPHPSLGYLMPIEVLAEGDPCAVERLLVDVEAGLRP